MATFEQKRDYYRKVRASNYEASCRLEGMLPRKQQEEEKELEGIKVELIDHMGDDLAVVDAARVSFNKKSEWARFDCHDCHNSVQEACADGCACIEEGALAFKTLTEGDKKLIKFLATHNHWTPFAHTALKFRVAAPVPIRTQCFKHKIGMVENEESRRYISTVPEIFIPEVFRAKPEGSIKQGSGGAHKNSQGWKEAYVVQTNQAVSLYCDMLDDGICPEQARFVLPQGAIVNWIWTGNLVSFANFYLKRTDSHAQVEVQEVAKQVGALVKEIFPVSWSALVGE
jgi:thymidylate synthase (FAD)